MYARSNIALLTKVMKIRFQTYVGILVQIRDFFLNNLGLVLG